MKFKSIINTNKDLKKNGYKMIRKLHKMEKKKGMEKAYKVSFENTYMFVLYCKGLMELIEMEYGETDEFVSLFSKKCKNFMKYLESISVSKNKISKTYLTSFLKSYTKFFNKIVDKKYPFIFNQEVREKWDIDCLMAYIATWGA